MLLLLLLSCSGGADDPPGRPGDPNPGFVAPKKAKKMSEEMQMLDAIGYVGEGTETTDKSGVTVHKPTAWSGRNLVVSGHAPQADLVEMDGTVLHTWAQTFATAFPVKYMQKRDSAGAFKMNFYRRARVTDDGHLYAMFGGLGVMKLDRDSNVVWTFDQTVHHDIDIGPDGKVYTLTRERRPPRKRIIQDFVVVLDEDGNVLHKLSLLAALENSPFRSLWDESPLKRGDVFHTNTIRYLHGDLPDHPAFKEGNILVSLRELNAIGVLDPNLGRFVWAHSGDYRAQHDPLVTPDGTLVLFDNIGLGEHSRILEFTPQGQPVWSIEGSMVFPFFSRVCGAVDRLPNGNTLVSETNGGRAFEVTPSREVVWEYYNPARGGDNNDLIAKIFEVQRLPANYGDDWLPAR